MLHFRTRGCSLWFRMKEILVGPEEDRAAGSACLARGRARAGGLRLGLCRGGRRARPVSRGAGPTSSGTPISGICLVYAWYIPCICRCPTYTWYIHGIYLDIPCISIRLDIHGISWDILCISTKYIHGISVNIHGISFDVYTWYIRGISWYIHGYS